MATHASRVAALEADFASVQAEFQGAHADEARIRWTFRERLPTFLENPYRLFHSFFGGKLPLQRV